MSFTDAPAILTQLRTQIAACAAWTTYTSSAIHYPDLASLMSATMPLAVLAETSRTATPYADGASPIAGGALEIVIYGTDSIGTIESLARTLLSQLLAQATGIPFRPGECGVSSDPSPAMVAGASGVRSVTITLSWGLST